MAEIVFNRIKIDSLKVIIPMAEVQIIDGRFNQEYVNQKVFIDSGEVVEQLNRDTKTYSDLNGIKVKLEVVSIKFGNVSLKENKGEPYLVFQPSSKFLKENYFDGINLHNLLKIYEYLISLKIVWFSYESFLKARFADVDFCLDFISSKEHFTEMTKTIHESVLITLNSLVKSFSAELNLGLQFNYRERATPTKPYLKFYHKSTELIHNSNEFYKNYLQEFNPIVQKGIGRMEITLKNSKFKNHYNINARTVKELFNIPQTEIENMFHQYLPNYIQIRKKVMSAEHTPTELMLLNFIDLLIQSGRSEIELLHYGLNRIENKTQKSRSKKVLETLLKEVQNPKLLEQNNEHKKEVNSILKVVGFYRD